MSLKLINNYVDGDVEVKEYGLNEQNITHIEKVKIQTQLFESEQAVEPTLSQEEIQLQTLLNTELLVIMSEIGGL